MPPWHHKPLRPIGLYLVLIGLLAPDPPSRASCDVIPMVKQTMPSAAGTVDRPFAAAGDWVEIGQESGCQRDTPTFFPRPGEQTVTIVFRPPTGRRHVVVLSTDCAAIKPLRQSCEARRDVASV